MIPEMRLGPARLLAIAGMACLTLGVALGGWSRLSYHEAFVAQAAREMLAEGIGLIPTIGGRPWLEKPPLSIWLVVLLGKCAGGVNEVVARVPSAVAAALLALGIATFAARRFGRTVGLLTGLAQVSMAWTMMRGRLAEADMLLACLVTWTLVAFDQARHEPEGPRRWRWGFFVGLGLTALAKGIGFGAALVLSVLALVAVWERGGKGIRRLGFAWGWAVAALIGGLWPLLVVCWEPRALELWTLHFRDRLASQPTHFAGGPWWLYAPALLEQSLPWTPLALVGAWRSFRRAREPGLAGEPDRLLWAWAVAPVVLLSLATVKNGHYAIHALPPWSVWTGLSLARLGARLRKRGWAPERVRLAGGLGFGTLGLACALGFAYLGPRLDRRGVEWAFYETASQSIEPNEPLVLLYDDWDRLPYPTPFGPVPHDLAIRLYSFGRPASWRDGVNDLADHPPALTPGASSGSESGSDSRTPLPPFAVLGRERDLPDLQRLGQVQVLAEGPRLRSSASRVDDRTFSLYRVVPNSGPEGLASARSSPNPSR